MNYAEPASDASLARAVEALAADNFTVHVVEDGAAALRKALELIPEGAQVMTMSSVTCTQIGLYKAIDESGKYDSVRSRFKTMDPKDPAQHREMQRLGAAPEWSVGSVHAVTEDGHLLIASQSGSQLPAHVAGADHVLFVVGTQKIVADTQEGMKRVYEYALPLENDRAMKAYGFGSAVNDLLIMNKLSNRAKGRVTVIFIKEKIGF